MDKNSSKKIPFSRVLEALLDMTTPFPPLLLYRFSDLEEADLKEVKKIWKQVLTFRRLALLEDFEELAEADTLMCFDEMGYLGLEDTDAQVRAQAIRLLWDCEDKKLIPLLMNLLENDADENVRAAAATGLGRFIYLGEIEEIPARSMTQIEDLLLSVVGGNSSDLIRRRALESLGYSGRDEISPLLENAYRTNDTDWMASALFAMGRSADNHWEDHVVNMLDHPDSRVRTEAIAAAGELALASTRDTLLDILEDEEVDDELRSTTIWALSQIGGGKVREVLETLLEDTEDDEEVSFLEEAVDNLSFTEDFAIFDLFDIEADDLKLDDDLESDETDSDGSYEDDLKDKQ